MLRVFKDDVKWVTREQPFRCEQTGHDGIRRTLYQLIVDVLAEHLNLFKTNPPLGLNFLSLVVKGTLVVEYSLTILLLLCGL